MLPDTHQVIVRLRRERSHKGRKKTRAVVGDAMAAEVRRRMEDLQIPFPKHLVPKGWECLMSPRDFTAHQLHIFFAERLPMLTLRTLILFGMSAHQYITARRRAWQLQAQQSASQHSIPCGTHVVNGLSLAWKKWQLWGTRLPILIWVTMIQT